MSNASPASLQELIFSGAVLIIIATITAVGNSLVILSVALVKKLQTPSNFLIVSLAVSDFLVSLLVMPYAIYYVLMSGRWKLGEVLCDLFTCFDVLLCTSSILNLCAISIDRYLAIIKPLQYASKRTPKRMFLMIFLVWILSALISIPPIFGFKNPFKDNECLVSKDLIYQIYATVMAFYVPLIVMIVLYIRILKLARRLAKADMKQNFATRSASDGLDMPASPCPSTRKYPIGVETQTSMLLPQDVKNRQALSAEERYPLPPSNLCRRKHPRPLHKLSSYTTLFTPDEDRVAFNTDVSLPFVDQSVDTVSQPIHSVSNNTSPVKTDHVERPQSPLVRSYTPDGTQISDPCERNNVSCPNMHMYRPKPGAFKQRPPWQSKKGYIGNSLNFAHLENSHQLLPMENEQPLEFFVGRRRSSALMNRLMNSKNKESYELSPNHQLKRPSFFSSDLSNRSRNASWISLRIPIKRKKSRLQGETKAIKTLGIIMGCFCLCWIPFFIIAVSLLYHMIT
ncbi:5-hydroxytryptamine receptor 7 [Cichlidogyrus casuarinus]|uniref:5-hydroxytryptamine receptor 7 n=1 Tax=Cichlidogyrus casuarinus TaxID=1844966 RepID=A0ABD2QCI7_9PLAT